MASLNGQTIASSYEQLLHVDRDGGGNSTTLVDVKDGDNGTTFALKLATDKIQVNGSSDLDGAVTINESSADVDFRVESNNESNMLFVDGGNDAVSISGSPRTGVTGYAYSGLNIEGTSFQGILSVIENQNDVSGGVVAIGHSRGTSANSNTILQDNDNIGRVTFNPNDGVDFRVIGAEIRSRVESDGSLAADNIGADLSFWTNDGDAVDAHERMTIMADGKVGINSTSPATRFEINDTNNIPLRFGDVASTPSATGGYIGMSTSAYNGNNGDLVLIPRTSAASNICLMGVKTGVGEAQPDTSLHIKGAGDTYVTLEAGASDGNVGLLFDDSGSNQHGFVLYDTDDDIMTFGSANTERMRITSAGAVYLNTDSSKFAVGAEPNSNWGNSYDAIQVGHSGTLYCETADNADRNFYIGNNTLHNGSNHRTIYNDEVSAIQFRAGTIRFNTQGTTANSVNLTAGGGVERMRVTDGGKVGIGNTSPAHTLTVEDNVNAYTASFKNNRNPSSSAPYVAMFRFHETPDNGTSEFLRCDDSVGSSAVARLIISSEGDVTNHDNSYGSISDKRIKQDIKDANSQWDDIKAVRVRNFKKNDDVAQYGDKAWQQIGVIAQELEEAGMDKLVKEHPATDNEIDVNDDINKGDMVKTVSYSVLYMKSIKALQEAMAKIETLEAKVEALENA